MAKNASWSPFSFSSSSTLHVDNRLTGSFGAYLGAVYVLYERSRLPKGHKNRPWTAAVASSSSSGLRYSLSYTATHATLEMSARRRLRSKRPREEDEIDSEAEIEPPSKCSAIETEEEEENQEGKWPKRQRRKTQKGLELEQLFRRPSSAETSSSTKDVSDGGGMTPTTEMTEKTQSSESPPDSDPQKDPLSILYETVVEYRDESGRRLSDIFQKLPSKSKYPNYYRVIVEPIDLKMIGAKLKNGDYKDVFDLESDLTLMVKNARHFNEPTSQVYKDATTLNKIVKAKKRELRLRARKVVDPSQMDLYKFVAEFRNKHGRLLSEAFQELPSKKEYPNYYVTIAEPMCFSMVFENIQKGMYETVEQLEEHVMLIFLNARTFNESSSRIYKDATKLMHVTQEKKRALTEPSPPPEKDQEELVKVASRQRESSSQEGAAVNLDETGAVDGDLTQRLRNLYDAVREHRDSNETRISDSFLSLLNNEINMETILKKIESNEYLNEDDCLADFDFMLSNVQISHDAESQLFKDAEQLIQLLKVLREPEEIPDLPAEIQAFTLSKKVYVLGSELGSYLGLTRGEIFKRFPFLARKTASAEERKQLLSQGMTSSGGHSLTLLLAKDAAHVLVEQRIREQSQKRMTSPSASYVGSSDVGLRFRYLPQEFLHHLACSNDVDSPPTHPQAIDALPEARLEEQYVLLETVKACKDADGREISALFLELPSRLVYPHYYQIIRKPMSIRKIEGKIRSQAYQSLDQVMGDLVIMCDNACRFNEQGSSIYLDSLTLLKVAFRTRKCLLGETKPIEYPIVVEKMRELLSLTYQSVMAYKTEAGRCPSDSFFVALSTIGTRLEQDYYTHLDAMQRSFFSVLEEVRRSTSLESLAYEDAVLLQKIFLLERDRVFRGGGSQSRLPRLQSPAFSVTVNTLAKVLALERQEKKESDESSTHEDLKLPEDVVFEDCCVVGDVECRAGEFVYLMRDGQSTIFFIEKLWIDKEDLVMAFGKFLYRPRETMHPPEQKFLSQEVLLGDTSVCVHLAKIDGKCSVMFTVNYFTDYPEAFEDSDVYYCELVYNPTTKVIKSCKTPSAIKASLEKRSTPLPFDRNPCPSVDDDISTASQHKEIERPQIVQLTAPSASSDDGTTFYEQYCTNSGSSVKIGDFVYVQTEKEYPFIARIDQIWTDTSGKAWFHGPWFVRPFEVEHLPTRTFFVREVLLSSVQDTNPLDSIISRCAIVNVKDYARGRPLGIAEKDVYVCESRYNEAEQLIRKLKALKRFSHSNKVEPDEFLYFEKEIWPHKTPSPFLFDNFPDLLGASDPWNSRDISLGFVLYSSDFICRQTSKEGQLSAAANFAVVMENALDEWSKEDIASRAQYDERAENLMPAKKTDGRGGRGDGGDDDTSLAAEDMDIEEATYSCYWQNCGREFNDSATLVSHVLATIPEGHAFPPKSDASNCFCLWAGCSRFKKPFTSAGKLTRHLKNMHLKSYLNFVDLSLLGESRRSHVSVSTAPPTIAQPSKPLLCESCQGIVSQPQTIAGAARSSDPSVATAATSSSRAVPSGFRFVEPPPNPKKLYYSQAYLKYVDGLRKGQQTISAATDVTGNSFDGERRRSIANERQVEKQWLAAGRGTHESVVEALWALKDAMMQDSLKLASFLESS